MHMDWSVAVIGAGFGDEGKGHVVDYLCNKLADPLVVRFSGGHQAAHQVITDDGVDHVFASFGSGTLQGAPTYWSKFCPVNPPAMLTEYEVLRSKGIEPKLYVDAKAPVTTPYEIQWNQNQNIMKDGTCGVGMFATKKREADHFHLLFEDLFYPNVLRMKMDMIDKYYFSRPDEEALVDFYAACEWVTNPSSTSLCHHYELVAKQHRNVVFEGSQGLLLDQNYGFYPHVTPSNTDTTNIAKMKLDISESWLVTRAYQTRHGNGPMSRVVPHAIADNPYEKNGNNGPQGEFRRTLLDLEMLRYAANKHRYPRRHFGTVVVTCMDLMDEEKRLQDGNKIIECGDDQEFLGHIQTAVGAETVYISRGPHTSEIRKGEPKCGKQL